MTNVLFQILFENKFEGIKSVLLLSRIWNMMNINYLEGLKRIYQFAFSNLAIGDGIFNNTPNAECVSRIYERIYYDYIKSVNVK